MIGVEALVVVVHGNRENLLSSMLPNHILVEVAVHLRKEGRKGGGGGERESEREEGGREMSKSKLISCFTLENL